MSPYLAFQLYSVASEMPCLRARSAVFAPASCSCRTAIICSSVNLIRFIVRPLMRPDSNSRWRKNSVAGQGVQGKELKDKSNVDTRWSTDHHLALAQRDFGIIDPALKYFLQGVPLEKVIDPEEIEEAKGASFYGNIGRCLHL